MIQNIKFDRECNFTGRNGYFKQSGIQVMDVSDNKVMIIPLTSKGMSARCDIEIPKECIPEMVSKLLHFYHQK